MSIRVAIVEDEKEIREMLAVLLNGTAGYSCLKTFENAETALAGIPGLEADVVLVDIHLPHQSGIELIAKLKEKRVRAQFMIFSSLEDSDSIFKALEAGATGYITKATSPARLLEAITDLHNGGSPMNSHIARKVIDAFQEKKPVPSQEVAKLTPREQELLALLAKGYRYKEIADRMFVSIDTVRTHIRNIYEKLQVSSRTEALNKIFPR